jgi:xanthine dehydrogenase accessory factor
MAQDVWQKVIDWQNEGRPCALATVVKAEGSVPRQPGAKMLIGSDESVGTVGGGALELAVTDAAREVLRADEPRLLAYNLKPDLGMSCGGFAEVFIEPLFPTQRLYVFGAGHIGKALCPLAVNIGFSVTIIDERRDMANQARFPQATALIHSFDPNRWAELLFDERTYCVVVTPSHKPDGEIVRALLERPCRYIGMIGSKNKRRSTEKFLLESGITPQKIAALHTPIGVSIGAETPEEIALSIAAELVMERRSALALPAPGRCDEHP